MLQQVHAISISKCVVIIGEGSYRINVITSPPFVCDMLLVKRGLSP